MQLMECDAKALLSRYAVASPSGTIATTTQEAEAAASRLGADAIFVKAQIRAGGRMAAGGIRTVRSAADVKGAAAALLGRRLATAQTRPEGLTVTKVLVEQTVRASREFYLSARIDDTSAAERTMRMPPAAIRPPARICAFTKIESAPRRNAAASASCVVVAMIPAGLVIAWRDNSALASHSMSCMASTSR